MFRKLTQGSGDGSPHTGAPQETVSRDEFWRVVEALNEAAATPADKAAQLRSWLEAADSGMLCAFDDHLQDLVDGAYRWPLWAAARILRDECADDCFTHFRACLVFMGQQVYEAACADPDTLSRLDEAALRGMFHEDLLYIAMDVFEETTGGVIERSKPSPVRPAGDPYDEDDPDELRKCCPELWARFAK